MNAINAAYARSYGSGAPAVTHNAPPPAGINMAPINAAYAHSYGSSAPAVAAAPAAAAPAAAAYHAATPGTPGTPQGAMPAAIHPFLTPDQQAALDSFDLNTGYGLAAEQRSIGQTQQSLALSQANNALQGQQAQRSHDQNTSMNNQTAGARGIFDSSIHANDLTDINTTLSMRQQSLSLALQSAQNNASASMANANAAIARLNTQSGITHNLYSVYGVQNASAQTPVLPTPAVPGTPGTPASGAPPAPRPNSVTSPNSPIQATNQTTNQQMQQNQSIFNKSATPKPPSYSGPGIGSIAVAGHPNW